MWNWLWRTRRAAVFVPLAVLVACSDQPPTDLDPDPAPEPEEHLFLISREYNGQVPRSALAVNIAQLDLGDVFEAQFAVDHFSVTYRTVGVDGSEEVASGALMVPAGTPRGTAVYHHGTAFPRTNVPSNPSTGENGVGALFATSGYAVIMPDYLGMGTSTGTHPWHHAQSTATASRDMIRAARELATVTTAAVPGPLLLMGYSQGGHATLATQRLLEQAHAAEFEILGSAPMAGAYDLEGSGRFVLANDDDYDKMILYSIYLATVYNDLYEITPTLGDILAPGAVQLGHDLLQNDQTVNHYVGRVPDRLRSAFRPEFLEALEADPQHPYWSRLAENSVFDWMPQAPVHLIHAQGDRDVPFLNADALLAAMQARGADVQLTALGERHDHSSGVMPSLVVTKQWFDSLIEAP